MIGSFFGKFAGIMGILGKIGKIGRTKMADTEATMKYKTAIELRLTKLETQHESLISDVREIKITLRWLVGTVFGLNTTIIGILTKGFGIFVGS